ncbi:MAG: SDR family oxidoreductase [Actinobacteria bacterium]|nr:SDR family oxidoreductase [Actinomycetota bacterium]
MHISDKIVVITGGGSGNGEALARRFATEGPRSLVIADIDPDRARRVAEEVGGVPFEVDVSDPEANHRLIEMTEDRDGVIDLFCANAGYGHAGSEQDDPETWDRMWQVNLMSQVHAARFLIPGWLARGEGYLLCTASAAGLLSNIGAAQYSVTKHASVALAEWLSVTYGDRGIKVSCLCPMFVRTPLVEDMTGLEELIRPSLIEPAQVAEAVVDGLGEERFLILPHPEVERYIQNKANDYEKWLAGMRRLQRSVLSS